MPATDIRFYCEEDDVPVLQWLENLAERVPKAYAKIRAKLSLLAALGHELRRPAADILDDGIYELRAEHQRVNYRLLYCFHGRDVVVLLHGLTKERTIPGADMQRAKDRRTRYLALPDAHTYADDGDE